MPRFALALAACAVPGVAVADHSHHHDHSHHQAAPDDPELGSVFAATVSLTAAQYTNPQFIGDYQGLEAGLRWTRGRFGAMATIPAYRLLKNGARRSGLGDVMAHGQVTALEAGRVLAGIGLAVSAPTGSQRDGLGMGHVMLMPGAWGTVLVGRVALGGSFGYGRALGGDGARHEHGAGPIVDPMNFEELTWSASADLGLAAALRVGARVSGAIALDDAGVDRAFAGVRALWTEGPVATGAELQVGLDGDPFNVRGVIETAVTF